MDVLINIGFIFVIFFEKKDIIVRYSILRCVLLLFFLELLYFVFFFSYYLLWLNFMIFLNFFKKYLNYCVD